MRILPIGTRSSVLARALHSIRRILRPPGTELEFVEAVVRAERSQHYAEAVRLCDQGLKRYPDDYDILMKRVARAREARDAALAEELLARAAPACPETAAALVGVGEELAYLGKMADATGYFRRAVARSPDDGLVREKLAMSLVSQRNMDEGVRELRKALDLEPGSVERRTLLVKTLLQVERYHEIVDLLQGVPESEMTWDCLTCLSMARARMDGTDPFVERRAEMDALAVAREQAPKLISLADLENRRVEGETS